MVGCDYGMAAGADLAYANKHAATHKVPNDSNGNRFFFPNLMNGLIINSFFRADDKNTQNCSENVPAEITVRIQT
jgi:hypothetical protein